jgi:hypothetical protein
MVDRTPSDHVRLDIAFSTAPDATSPAWVDVTSRLRLSQGITISRGRTNEYDTIRQGTMSCTLENIDGYLTPDNVSSAYYPNVLPQRRIRLTYRDPATIGQNNFLAAEDASFEGGTTGTWGQSGGVTFANDTTHADDGTKALRATWPTASAGVAKMGVLVSGMVQGRTYTARARVWSATGVPDIKLTESGGTAGTATSTKNAFATITLTFIPTNPDTLIYVTTAGSSTSGQQTWIDAVMVDEGSSLGTFTTTAPPIYGKFDGHIDEWPVEWPDGGENYAHSTITASDLLSRIDTRQELRSVVVETMALDGPAAHYPLDEPDKSTKVYDIVERTTAVSLSLQQVGSGGTITFASGTGVPTDGGAAPQFAPSSSVNGLMLAGRTALLNASNADSTIVAAAATTTAAVAVIAGMFDDFGNGLTIEVAASGKFVANYVLPGYGLSVSTTSASTYNDGQTHHVAGTVSQSGGTITVRLVVDGSASTTATQANFPAGVVVFVNVLIGGLRTGKLFTGTISHVAVFPSNLDVSRLLEQRNSQTTGFAGERSDQRIARYCTWIGLPTARQTLDVGNSLTISHFDTAGLSPLAAMRKVEATEAGLLFAGTSGTLVFYSRSRLYTAAAADIDVPASMIDGSSRLAKNLQLVKNAIDGTRADGAKYRAIDTASRTAYGQVQETLELVTTNDSEVVDAVNWRLNTSSKPLTRFTSMQLDAYTDATYSPTILAKVMIGARARISGLPAQAPASALVQMVQGYTETIGTNGWDVDVNATPLEQMTAVIADDTTYGLADGPYVAAY